MPHPDPHDGPQADRGPSLSARASGTMLDLEYLTQVLPDTPALDPAVLVRRAGLTGVCSGEDLARELIDAGVVSWTESGITPTGRPWNGPSRFSSRITFDYDLHDDDELLVPHGWKPTAEQIEATEYHRDEYLMARLGLLAVIGVLARDGGGRVRIGALHAWDRDPVDTVLNLILDGVLPDQPHLSAQRDEFRAYRQLDGIEAGMPATLIKA